MLTAATLSSVGLPDTLPVLPRLGIEQLVLAEMVLHVIRPPPVCVTLVRPRPSKEPDTVYFVTDVALFVPSLTEIEYAPFPENGTVNVTLTAPRFELVPPLVIVACVTPNVTVSALFGLKFVPVIVTLEPTAPDTGLGSPSEMTWFRSAIESLTVKASDLPPLLTVSAICRRGR